MYAPEKRSKEKKKKKGNRKEREREREAHPGEIGVIEPRRRRND
jgi:hypothetical protein